MTGLPSSLRAAAVLAFVPLVALRPADQRGRAPRHRGRLQNTWDELNLIRPGGNKGWPTVEGIGANGRNGIPTAASKAFFEGRYGRLRTVAAAPDGSLWLVTNITDRRGIPRLGDDRVLGIELR